MAKVEYKIGSRFKEEKFTIRTTEIARGLHGCIVSKFLADDIDCFNKDIKREDYRAGCFAEFFGNFHRFFVIVIVLVNERDERTESAINGWSTVFSIKYVINSR